MVWNCHALVFSLFHTHGFKFLMHGKWNQQAYKTRESVGENQVGYRKTRSLHTSSLALAFSVE
jgi:hypothetical protein